MTVLQRRRVSPHKHARNRHLRCQPFKACIVAFPLTNPGRRLTSNTLEGCASSLTARRAAERRRRTGSAAAAAIQRFGRWRTAGHRRRPCPGQSSVLLPAFLSETAMSLPSSPPLSTSQIVRRARDGTQSRPHAFTRTSRRRI